MKEQMKSAILAAYRTLLRQVDSSNTHLWPICLRTVVEETGQITYVLASTRGNEAFLVKLDDFASKEAADQSLALGAQNRLEPLGRAMLVTAQDIAQSPVVGGGIVSIGELLRSMPWSFGYGEGVEAQVISQGMCKIGERAVEGLDTEFRASLSPSDLWRVAAELIAVQAGVDVAYEALPKLIAEALLDEARTDIDGFARELGDRLVRATKGLSAAPDHEVAPHVLRYYLEAPNEEILTRRLQAAEGYPAYAGLIGNINRVSQAVDMGEPVGDMLLVATQCQGRKKLFRRLQGEHNPIARQMLETGSLDDLPLDWLPKVPGEWRALRDIEEMWRLAVPGDTHVKPVIWSQELFAGSKGVFSDFAAKIAREVADRRPPNGTGPAAAAHFKAHLNIKAIGTGGNVVRELIERTNRAFGAIPDDQLSAAGWPTETSVGAWLRKSCVSYGDMQDLQRAGETIFQLVDAFATRVILPTALMAEKTIAMPITRALLTEARKSAAEILFAGKNSTTIAGMARQFIGHSAELTQSLVSDAEIRMRREQQQKTAAWRRVSEDRKAVQWMEFFRIAGDTEDLHPLTPIQEFAPGYIAVPLFNRQQYMEEGNWGRSGLDRCGVEEMHNCIGPWKSPDYILSEGLRQAFSVRKIEGTTYVRSMTVAVQLSVEEGMPKLRIIEAKAPHNSSLSPAQAEQLDRFLAKIISQNLINPKLIEKALQVSQGVKKEKDNQVALETLLGYSPFPVFKTISALRIWQESGILPSQWRGLQINQVGEIAEVRPVRTFIREVVSMRSGMTLNRQVHVDIPAFDKKAKPRQIEMRQGQRAQARSLFTSSGPEPEIG